MLPLLLIFNSNSARKAVSEREKRERESEREKRERESERKKETEKRKRRVSLHLLRSSEK